MKIPHGVEHPWQLTRDQWCELRESVRANVTQSSPSKSDKSTALRRAEIMDWLLFGIHLAERPATWDDVIGKARREGLLTSNRLDEKMVVPAFRYCLGRMSYIVGDCCDFLVLNWAEFQQNTQNVIKRELEEAFSADDDDRKSGNELKRLGHDCDREQWERVRKIWMSA